MVYEINISPQRKNLCGEFLNLQKINKISQANRLNFALNNTFSRDEADELLSGDTFYGIVLPSKIA